MRFLRYMFIGIIAAHAHAAPYQHDDGTSESSSGFNVDGNVAWLQTFKVAGGLNEITSIELAFGSSNRTQTPDSPYTTTPLVGGESFNVYVWAGTPYSAAHPFGPGVYTLLAQATATVDAGCVDTDILQTVPISATIPGGDGADFFIGASIDIPGYGWPAAFDRAPVQSGGNLNGHAFLTGTFFYGGFDPHDISGGQAGFPLQISNFIADGQWIMRANAIPEPATALLLAAGLVGLTAARRKNS